MTTDTIFYGESFVGKRNNNEDSFCCEQINENLIILAVADGMGGAAAGERASSIAIDALLETFRNAPFKEDSNYLKDLVKNAYLTAQEKIVSESKADTSLSGMGTTLNLSLIVNKNKVIYANLGDSRLYQVQEGKISCLTRDHSYIQEHLENNGGEISPQIIRKFGNYLTKSLDGGGDLPDIYPVETDFYLLKEGTILFHCSDGLILHEPDEEHKLKEIILETKTVPEAVKELINDAFNRGSSDNITVVIYEYGHHLRIGKLKRLMGTLRRGITSVIPDKRPEIPAKPEEKIINKQSGKVRLILPAAIVLLATLLAIAYFTLLKKDSETHPSQNHRIAPAKHRKEQSATRKDGKLSEKWKPFSDQPNTLPYTSTLTWNDYPEVGGIYLIYINDKPVKQLSESYVKIADLHKLVRGGTYNIRVDYSLQGKTVEGNVLVLKVN